MPFPLRSVSRFVMLVVLGGSGLGCDALRPGESESGRLPKTSPGEPNAKPPSQTAKKSAPPLPSRPAPPGPAAANMDKARVADRGSADPSTGDTAEPAQPPREEGDAPEPKRPKTLAEIYIGEHPLGVNRVTDGRRTGQAIIRQTAEGRFTIHGRVKKGPYELTLSGRVTPRSPLEFDLDGTIDGIPNKSYMGEEPTGRSTKGVFTFRATKGRNFWRLYEVNGRDCVCGDDCGNDFCYIDVGF
ncbi:MAG: hypothetical protein KC416_14025 [Myxococcales bacterium]|nr:hypothetical protein [Myxococcales bacterium]